MSQQIMSRPGTEGPYASASVMNGHEGRYQAAAMDLEAQRPHSTIERQRSGSRAETQSQMVVSERPHSTTVSKV